MNVVVRLKRRNKKDRSVSVIVTCQIQRDGGIVLNCPHSAQLK